MILGWKIDDVRRNNAPVYVGLAQMDFMSFTTQNIVSIHFWKKLTKSKGHTLTHHAHGVYCVHESLSFRFEDIAD
jgi:hypothetical protein